MIQSKILVLSFFVYSQTICTPLEPQKIRPRVRLEYGTPLVPSKKPISDPSYRCFLNHEKVDMSVNISCGGLCGGNQIHHLDS